MLNSCLWAAHTSDCLGFQSAHFSCYRYYFIFNRLKFIDFFWSEQPDGMFRWIYFTYRNGRENIWKGKAHSKNKTKKNPGDWLGKPSVCRIETGPVRFWLLVELVWNNLRFLLDVSCDTTHVDTDWLHNTKSLWKCLWLVRLMSKISDLKSQRSKFIANLDNLGWLLLWPQFQIKKKRFQINHRLTDSSSL